MSNENMMIISREWATRPDDERFISLPEMHARLTDQKDHAREKTLTLANLRAAPQDGDIRICGPGGRGATFTNWAWNQLCGEVDAPGRHLARLPADMACDALNWFIQDHHKTHRSVKPDGSEKAPRGKLLIDVDGDNMEIRALTGPDYGRIWNADVVQLLMDHVGNGVTGKWKVPGEFGKDVGVTRQNTTLYASDRDMFIALANEQDRITLPARRDGKSGTLAQGFILGNSEVGDKQYWGAYFLFDFLCCNRIIWGLNEWREFKFRHTKKAPGIWREPAHRMVEHGTDFDPREVTQHLLEAQRHTLPDPFAFLLKHVKVQRTANDALEAFKQDEGRPLTSRWDAVTAVTALARDARYQDDRVKLEAIGGKMLALAA